MERRHSLSAAEAAALDFRFELPCDNSRVVGNPEVIQKRAWGKSPTAVPGSLPADLK